MGFGEGTEGLGDHPTFGFTPEIDKIENKPDKGNNFEITEIEMETDFQIEISEADIQDIEERIEKDRENEGLEGLGGSQAVVLETILERKREEVGEIGTETEKAEFTDKDVIKFEINKSEDIKKATAAIKSKGEEKGWSEEQVEGEIKSEETWIEDVQTSYLKKILDMEENKKEGGVENVRWNRMADNLINLIKDNKWDKVIPHAGQMNNLDPEKFEKFKEKEKSLFDAKFKKNILQEIESSRKGKEGLGNDVNPWKLASDVRYVTQSFPELKSKVEISGKEQKIMEKYLTQLQKREWAVNELTAFGKKGEYWKVIHMKDNMEIVQKMIDDGEIKVTE